MKAGNLVKQKVDFAEVLMVKQNLLITLFHCFLCGYLGSSARYRLIIYSILLKLLNGKRLNYTYTYI